jgi:hypothetical protein
MPLSSNSWASKPGFWEAYYHLTGLLGCGIIISYCHLWAKGFVGTVKIMKDPELGNSWGFGFINLWLFWSFICHDWGNSAICVGCYAISMHYWCFDVLVDWLCGCTPLLLWSPHGFAFVISMQVLHICVPSIVAWVRGMKEFRFWGGIYAMDGQYLCNQAITVSYATRTILKGNTMVLLQGPHPSLLCFDVI